MLRCHGRGPAGPATEIARTEPAGPAAGRWPLLIAPRPSSSAAARRRLALYFVLSADYREAKARRVSTCRSFMQYVFHNWIELTSKYFSAHESQEQTDFCIPVKSLLPMLCLTLSAGLFMT